MMASSASEYPIGIPGKPWGEEEKRQWRAQQTIQRSYQRDIVEPLKAFEQDEQLPGYHLVTYGTLDYSSQEYAAQQYSLFAIIPKTLDEGKPTALITGGVHGYETSGVHGALRFLTSKARDYTPHFNLVVTPCISPWAYETINRWNPLAIDPNRSFVADSPAQESALLLSLIEDISPSIDLHIDLHETTDTDNSEFRPALAARDNVEHKEWAIPDGFYLVGDSDNPRDDFQKFIIEKVQSVTHIAPADEQGRIIGEPTTQFGVINYPTKALGLCTGFSGARYNTTTEVYPDSPKVDDENCIQAQVTAVTAALDYVLQQQ